MVQEDEWSLQCASKAPALSSERAQDGAGESKLVLREETGSHGGPDIQVDDGFSPITRKMMS